MSKLIDNVQMRSCLKLIVLWEVGFKYFELRVAFSLVDDVLNVFEWLYKIIVTSCTSSVSLFIYSSISSSISFSE